MIISSKYDVMFSMLKLELSALKLKWQGDFEAYDVEG